MKKLVLLLACAYFGFTPTNAQKCKTDIIRSQNLAENPAIQSNIDQIQDFTKKWVTDHAGQSQNRSIITLPMVVHVLYRTATENISDDQVLSQITVLNEDFQKQNANFSETADAFEGIAANVGVEFCMATTDPNGNPTNGITRTQTTVDNIGETEDWYKPSAGGVAPWDNTKYINVWVCDLGTGGTLGFATPPGTADPIESDGMVIAPEFFGTTGTAAASAPNNLGRTATHEMGHYLNLEHIWGPNGGCNDDDFVADTPNQEQDNFGCPTFPHFDGCTTSGNGLNYNNFLDYVDDNCMTMFTEGQKARMEAAINGPRAGLLASNVCNTMVSNNQIDASEHIRIFPNPSHGAITLDFTHFPAFEDLHFSLTNVLGTTQKTIAVQSLGQKQLTNIPAGVYQLSCHEYPSFAHKVIVLK